MIRLAFDYAVTNSSKSTTYKFALARSLLDQSITTNSINIKYSDIANDFFDYYWVLVKLRQNKKDDALVTQIIRKKFEEEFFSYSLTDIRKEQKKKVEECVKDIKKECLNYVVPIFEENAEDYLSLDFTKKERRWVIYQPDMEKKRNVEWKKGITLNPLAVEFLRDNYESLYQMVILQWIKFLEKYNSGIYNIIEKMDGTIEKREQEEFKDILKREKCCFYCNDNSKPFHVDHFFPFDLIGAAGLWNLVLACKDCNSKKSNKLPPVEYISRLKIRNNTYRNEISEYKNSLHKYGKKDDIKLHYNHMVGRRPIWDGPKLIHSISSSDS